jgi:hypothetical protein
VLSIILTSIHCFLFATKNIGSYISDPSSASSTTSFNSVNAHREKGDKSMATENPVKSPLPESENQHDVPKDTPNNDTSEDEDKIILSTHSVNLDDAIKVCSTVLPFSIIMYTLSLTLSFNRL